MSKLVIVTGCSKGLGKAICANLAEAGYQVLGIARSLSEGYKELMDKYPTVHFEQYDLGEISGLYDLSRKISKEYGNVYGLVNNAALGTDGVLTTMHERDIATLINVNVTSPITFTKYISRSFLKQREGRVINVSSIIASTGYSGLSVYAATKAALNGFTKSLSRELGKLGVTVNSVAPGYMETAMTEGLDKDKLETIKRRSALRALPHPDEVANMVEYLLSPKAKNITGTIFTIDAGNTA